MHTTSAKAIALLLFLFQLFANRASAQHWITVRDSSSSATLAGATVTSPGGHIHLMTDGAGKVEIPHSVFTHHEKLFITMVGYKPRIIAAAGILNNQIILQRSADTLQEVTLTRSRLKNIQVGMESVTAAEARNLPSVLGEVDIIKVLQLKPGVKSAGEGMAGFYVRGGGADQNLVRLDGIPIYNANHLLGLFSIFNNDAIHDAKLYKSGWPAGLGGRLSSVLDVTSRKASLDSFHVTGGAGLLSSRISVESPIQKGRSGFVISARRTYMDLITSSINKMNKGRQDYKPIPGYFFSELHLRSDWKVNTNNSVWSTVYIGSDHFSSLTKDYPAVFKWGNTGASLNWRSIINPVATLSSAVFYSRYQNDLSNGFGFNDTHVRSSVRTLGLNVTATTTGKLFKTQTGVNLMQHQTLIGNYTNASELLNFKSAQKAGGTEWATFIHTEWDRNKPLGLDGGVRLSGFTAGKKWYVNAEPRISARFDIDNHSVIKASYTRMYQYLHLASLSSISLPVDIWYPTTKRTKPEYADQLSVGYSRTIGRTFLMKAEGYYKWMNSQVEFRDGADLIGNPNIENDFVYGKANAYGIETYLEKKTGRTTGWIGYTLAWSTRTFADINDGLPFKPRYDRRHDFSLVVIHKLNDRFSCSFNWIYGSGAYTTLPVGRYFFQNESGVVPRSIVPVFGMRNNYQLPAVHRLDINFTAGLRSKRGKQDITFSLYNAYNRRNPFYIEYEQSGNKEGYITSILPKVVSLFPVLPAVTYNFKF